MLSEGDLSLGWALIEAWFELFPSPRDERAPFELTDGQVRNIVEWYRVHPRTGQFVYRRGCSRRSKGSGKSPLEAAKAISELALEVRFDHWAVRGETNRWGYQYQPGEPVGRRWGTGNDPAAWVQIASLSEDQDENTYTPLYSFLTGNDGRLANELRIDAGLTRCFLMDRADSKIEPVTSRAGSKEGQPVTYATIDESGMMTRQNGGLKLARTIRRNVGKMGGRSFETTNGFMPGEESVAEGTAKAVELGTAGIFYDAIEAPHFVDGVEVTEEAPDEVKRAALRVAYDDSWWVDLDRIVADIRDPDMPWSDAQRFFFNWNVKGEGQAVDPAKWSPLFTTVEFTDIEPGTYIGLGFDGSINDDSTALVGCTPDRHVFEIETWERPRNAPDNWRVPRAEVRARVSWAFERWRIGRMLCDPAKWWTEIDEWAVEFAKWSKKLGEDSVVVFDTNSNRRMAPACDRFATAVTEGELTWNGDALNRHVLAMARKKVVINADDQDGRTRFVFVKADTRKIDAGIAATLALEAAMTMKPERKSRARVISLAGVEA